MAQSLTQIQTQKQQQLQRLSAQQMLQVKLLEMPITELEQNVNAELDDNPALERASDEDVQSTDENPDDDKIGLEDGDDRSDNDSDTPEADLGGDDAVDEGYEQQSEREEREDALDNALQDLGRDDAMPDYETQRHSNQDNADYEEMVYGDTESFYDRLNEQMGTLELTDKQRQIMEYLIGSLDDDGLLRKDLGTISDELAIYHNCDATEDEIEKVLKILQTFDPAGIGARSLQECLLLQINRMKKGKLRDAMYTVIHDYFDDFTHKHWEKIQQAMELSPTQVQTLQEEIRKLNPKPGASLGETIGRNMQQITPDFIVDTNDDGSITFSLNQGNLPQLIVSPSFVDMVNTYKTNKGNMARSEKEALLYAKEKVDKAQGYIEAIRQRRHTMYVTMKAIIEWQHKFFEDGDEADLRPMILKDIADKTGLDISTISRVSNVKYAQTKWGTFPLRFFFTDSYTTKDGEEMSTRKIKLALKDLIDKEDKKHPLSDDALAKEMAKKGFPIARRTIAKYREQMDIPVARMRKN